MKWEGIHPGMDTFSIFVGMDTAGDAIGAALLTCDLPEVFVLQAGIQSAGTTSGLPCQTSQQVSLPIIPSIRIFSPWRSLPTFWLSDPVLQDSHLR
jgi:hypothetical protein